MLKNIIEDIKLINNNLLEAMDTKIDYNFEKDYEGIYVNFNVNNEKINLRFEPYLEDKFDLYEISFTRNGSDKLLNEYRETFKILGIVKNIIFDFIEEYNPDMFFYAVSEKSKARFSLYTKLANEITKNSNYNYIRSDKILDKTSANFLFYKDKNILKSIINNYKR